MSERILGNIKVDTLIVPGVEGVIGMCACPGGRRAQALDYDPATDLSRDLQTVASHGARLLVTLMEERELDMLGVHTLPLEVRRAGLDWKHLPITDMAAPTAVFERRWEHAREELHAALGAGEMIVLHCWAGLGRTGTVAAKLLVEFGMAPEAAILRVRDARRGTIQSRQQEKYVLKLKPPEETG